MYCRYCGKDIGDNDNFCIACGKPTGVGNTASSAGAAANTAEESRCEIKITLLPSVARIMFSNMVYSAMGSKALDGSSKRTNGASSANILAKESFCCSPIDKFSPFLSNSLVRMVSKPFSKLAIFS